MGTKSHKLFAPIALATAMAIWGSACVESDELVSPVIAPEYSGCISATALDTGRIEIRFEFPSNASRVRIYRDGGLVVGTFAQRDVTSHVDIGLEEGLTYTYSCEAMIDGVVTMGDRTVEATTVSANPPTFGGVTSVRVAGTRAALIHWNPGTGVPTSYYQVYFSPTKQSSPSLTMNPGTLLATIPIGTNELTIPNLGDELTYAFGVRACTERNICDTNTRFLPLTIPDAGAPLTVGATRAEVINGEIALTVPWDHTRGAIFKRVIYRSTTYSTDLASYGPPFQEIFVTEASEPPTAIKTGTLTENQTYYFIVQDYDVAGEDNGNLSVVSTRTGDLSKPIFSGLTGLANPADPALAETGLVATWTAIRTEDGTPPEPDGASYYLLYKTSAEDLGDLGNACTDAKEAFKTINATPFAAGAVMTETLTGLAPKTYYSVCVKAMDKAGNISSNTDNFIARTFDKTPPVFDGIQSLSFSYSTRRFTVGWHNPPAGSDIHHYKATFWRVDSVGTRHASTVKTLSPASSFPGTYEFSSGDVFFSDEDTVYALVDACDEDDNCTQSSEALAKSQTLPDLTAPQNFGGITSASSTAEGAAIVGWDVPVPGDWDDFSGFVVYDADLSGPPVLTELKRCFCPGYNCTAAFGHPTTPFTSCTLTGLPPYRIYKLHVRAFDASGNFAELDPAASYRAVTIRDQTAPTFTPTLSLSYLNGAVKLSWNAATDLQAPSNPASVISYRVFRKSGSNFATPSNPAAEGTLLTDPAIMDRQYSDSSGLTQFTDYYYVVCALDASGNMSCDTTGRFIKTPDTSPPALALSSITNVDSPNGPYLNETLTGSNKSWTFNWTMSDNNVATSAIRVQIYRAIADDRATFPDPDVAAPYKVLTGLSSPAALTESTSTSASFTDALKFANYLFIATDGTNRTAPIQASIMIDNRNPPAPVISSHSHDETMNVVTQTFTGSCKSDGATTTASAGTGSRILSVSCVADTLTVRVIFTPNEDYPQFSVTTTASNGNAAVLNFRVNNLFKCPANYLAIEANPTVGATTPFCVAKFEMKAVESHPELGSPALVNGGDGNLAFLSSYYPASRPDGTPWVNISQAQAASACPGLTLVDGSYSLISNQQWQAIAREIIGIPANWSQNAVGSGVVNRGHTDDAIPAAAISSGLAFGTSKALAASSGTVAFSDANAYVGTGQTNPDAWNGGTSAAGEEQKRTHTLLSGEVIWDFAGNVAELTSTLLSELVPTPAIPTAEYEFTNTAYFSNTLDTGNRLFFGPATVTYNSSKIMGMMYGGSRGAILRGGSWSETHYGGVFRTFLNSYATDQSNKNGFRCVYIPSGL